jgi:hypothetical protein
MYVKMRICLHPHQVYKTQPATRTFKVTEKIIAIIAASGGFILMVGALILLYKGKITIDAINRSIQKSPQAALAIQIGKIKVKSQYPTIALFLVAAGCFWLALEYAKGSKIKISGIVDAPDAANYTVTYNGALGLVYSDNGGNFEEEVPEDVNLFVLEIAKGGAAPERFNVYPHKVKEWPVKCKLHPAAATSVVQTPETNDSQIAKVPKELPPLQTQ